MVFVLDHIDGDAANNKRDNLRLICPNCDSQLEAFKSKNKKVVGVIIGKKNNERNINLYSWNVNNHSI